MKIHFVEDRGDCPGATDHSTAECPMVRVPRELLERTICRLTHGHEHDKAVRELRALLNGGEA